ncbi:BLUF domain-containing protein [Pararoseomonas indoligenes]|uniref:BLUF domain-containing protein n=1 Tax=Roseomonas indoligenes TaxID=2820811 RepID=A0A940MXF5_9PROT|nr:BLUF domain-containing protein [Pararoseomonas indoligenes]MBP0492256.1 BLUF domain-containing protein [Pararoseomonas indoligenes]
MTGNPESYRLIYISRNALRGTAAELEAEVGHILVVSRRNNARDGITGALLFNESCFAQVLEGGSDVVQEVFERIQLDPRHCDTVVLAFGPAPREFGEWSMAYAGAMGADSAGYHHLAMPGGAEAASGHILDLLRGVLLRQGAA